MEAIILGQSIREKEMAMVSTIALLIAQRIKAHGTKESNKVKGFLSFQMEPLTKAILKLAYVKGKVK
mgnify:CR=1 FL=1